MRMLASMGVGGAALVLASCGGGDSAQSDRAATARELRVMSGDYADATLDSLRGNDQAMALAGQLFEAHCADCHGSDGGAKRGVTDLTRGRFDYGASPDAIRTTIARGRQSEMPAMGAEYGEVELGQIVAFVEVLGSDIRLSDYERRGAELYAESCVACHGEDGHGMPALGASDLTDDYWQHGDSMMNMRLAITRGTLSECPAHGDLLAPVEVELLTAWVLGLFAD